MSLQYSADAVDLKLFVSAPEWSKFNGLGYSLHVVDQVSSQSVSGLDVPILRGGAWQSALFDPFSRYSQSMRVNIPPAAPANRAMWLVLTLWRETDGKFHRRQVISSDRQLLGDTQVILGEFVKKSRSDTAPTIALATFDIGFALESAHLPEQVQAGETLSVRFSWRASQDGHEDHAQFLHFGHEESGAWWVHDQSPLGERLPTRLWYSGLAESELWQLPLPRDLAPGVYAVYSGLYRHRDKERIIARDADGKAFLDARVPLGQILVKRAS